jgi:UDP-N-acetylglucosamine diphosphorylase / glucose-1-phosphate thymidylyltransferase / UDP-N-acetylgalactosamine diphosphorylase / glucosamine-1-phosphate N-acetyltransferase / galactosamine-1-phosphate N-acetyltransferase
MKVVILAAGRGKRMGEWTDTKTKAMLPIYENPNDIRPKPMLQITIERFRQAGLDDFVIVVGYRKNDIIAHFGDGSSMGIKIKYVTQKNPCAGTADAVACSNYFFEGHDYIDETCAFFLVYADVIPSCQDIDIMIRKYVSSEKESCGVMAVRTVSDPQRYGVVEINEKDEIIRIVEKSPNPPTNMINAGIYILPMDIFKFIKKTPISVRGEYELTDSIQMLINSDASMKIQSVNDFKDIGTKQIYEAEQKI